MIIDIQSVTFAINLFSFDFIAIPQQQSNDFMIHLALFLSLSLSLSLARSLSHALSLPLSLCVSPGISSLDSKASGKMGVRAVVYYMVTTLIAVFIGIVMVIIIQPGRGSRDSPAVAAANGNIEPVQAADAFLDLIR